MLNSKSDYLCLSADSLRHINIHGGAATPTQTLTGEEEAYIREALAERNRTAIPNSVSADIHTITDLTKSKDHCKAVYNLARGGTFVYPDKAEPTEVINTVNINRQVPDDPQEWQQKVREYKSQRDAALDKKREAYNTEKTQRQEDILKANEADKEERDKYTIAQEAAYNTKLDEIKTTEDADLDKEKARYEKEQEELEKEIKKKLEEETISSIEAERLRWKAEDEHLQKKEEIEKTASDDRQDAKVEYDGNVAEKEIWYDTRVSERQEEYDDWAAEQEEKLSKEADDIEDSVCAMATTAMMSGSTDVGTAMGYSQKQLDYTRAIEKEKLRISCVDAIPLLPYSSITMLNCALADLDRMTVYNSASFAFGRKAYSRTVKYPESIHTSYYDNFNSNNEIEFIYQSKHEEGVGSLSDKSWIILYGNRNETENGLVDFITADAIIGRNNYGRMDDTEEGGEGKSFQQLSCNIKRSVKFSYVGRWAAGSASKYDNANDAYLETVANNTEAYNEKIAAIDEELNSKIDSINATYDKAIETAQKARDKKIETANKTRVSAEFENIGQFNQRIFDNREKREEIQKEYLEIVDSAENQYLAVKNQATRDYESAVDSAGKSQTQSIKEAQAAADAKKKTEKSDLSEKNNAAYKIFRAVQQEITDADNAAEDAINERYKERLSAASEEESAKKETADEEARQSIPAEYIDDCEFNPSGSITWKGSGAMPQEVKNASGARYSAYVDAEKTYSDKKAAAEQERWQSRKTLEPFHDEGRMLFQSPQMSPVDACSGDWDYRGGEVTVSFSNFRVHYKYPAVTGKDYQKLYAKADEEAKRQGLID